MCEGSYCLSKIKCNHLFIGPLISLLLPLLAISPSSFFPFLAACSYCDETPRKFAGAPPPEPPRPPSHIRGLSEQAEPLRPASSGSCLPRADVYTGLPWGSVQKTLLPRQETQVRSLVREDPLEKEMAAPFSILAWEVHGRRSLAGHSPSGCGESGTTGQLDRNSTLHLSAALSARPTLSFACCTCKSTLYLCLFLPCQ